MEHAPTETKILAWAKLMRISRNLTSSMESELKAAGFPSLSVHDVLLELNQNPEKGLRPYELEERMLLAQYNISRIITRLTRDGYALKEKTLIDGRGQKLFITPSGQQLLQDMWPHYAKALEKHFGRKISEEEAHCLRDILKQLQK